MGVLEMITVAIFSTIGVSAVIGCLIWAHSREAKAVVETHVCPRRAEGGPLAYNAEFDEWRRNRWSMDIRRKQRETQKYVERQNRKFGHGSMSVSETADCWLDVGPVPRTCSYCGGIHPDDAITLFSRGWTLEITGKSYKRYMRPPARLDWDPVPPVKLYVMHFSAEQCDRMNELMQADNVKTSPENGAVSAG